MKINQLALMINEQIHNCKWKPSDRFYSIKANYHHNLANFAIDLVLNYLVSQDQQTITYQDQMCFRYQGQNVQVLLFVDDCVEATKYFIPLKSKKIKNYFVVYLSPNLVALKQATYSDLFKLKSAKQWLKTPPYYNADNQMQYLNWRDYFKQWFVALADVPFKDQKLAPLLLPKPEIITTSDLVSLNEQLNAKIDQESDQDINQEQPSNQSVQDDQTVTNAIVDQQEQHSLSDPEQLMADQISQIIENSTTDQQEGI